MSGRKDAWWLRLLGGALLGAWLCSASSALAADEPSDTVRVDCATLERESAAEIESRIRASLLTADIAATVVVTCDAPGVDVQAWAGPENVRVPAAGPASDEVLSAVEQALQELK